MISQIRLTIVLWYEWLNNPSGSNAWVPRAMLDKSP